MCVWDGQQDNVVEVRLHAAAEVIAQVFAAAAVIVIAVAQIFAII